MSIGELRDRLRLPLRRHHTKEIVLTEPFKRIPKRLLVRGHARRDSQHTTELPLRLEGQPFAEPRSERRSRMALREHIDPTPLECAVKRGRLHERFERHVHRIGIAGAGDPLPVCVPQFFRNRRDSQGLMGHGVEHERPLGSAGIGDGLLKRRGFGRATPRFQRCIQQKHPVMRHLLWPGVRDRIPHRFKLGRRGRGSCQVGQSLDGKAPRERRGPRMAAPLAKKVLHERLGAAKLLLADEGLNHRDQVLVILGEPFRVGDLCLPELFRRGPLATARRARLALENRQPV